MTTNREQGEKLLKEAEWIFERDLKIANTFLFAADES